MESVSFTCKEVADGTKLLARVLEKFKRSQSLEDYFELELYLADANAMFAHLSVHNLKSIIIRQNKEGYWTGELLLKRVPHGMPDMIGVPEHAPYCPYKNRNDVLYLLYLMIKCIWLKDRKKAPMEPTANLARSEPREPQAD